jgi:hypothetical protein
VPTLLPFLVQAQERLVRSVALRLLAASLHPAYGFVHLIQNHFLTVMHSPGLSLLQRVLLLTSLLGTLARYTSAKTSNLNDSAEYAGYKQ